MSIKTIIAAGIGVMTSVSAAMALTPMIALNTDYFASGSAQGGNTTRTTGTQGVVGNPNCPQPVEPGGIRPRNWSCPTGTQAVGGDLLASRPGTPSARTGSATRPLTGGQQAMQRQSSQLTQGQQAMLRRNSGTVRTANTQTANTGGGSATNQQLQAANAARNNGVRAQMIRAAAEATGQQVPTYGTPNSNLGRSFGLGEAARNSINRGLGQGSFRRH